MDTESLTEETLLHSGRESARVADFLRSQGLQLDDDVEFTVVLAAQGSIAATGSFAGRVLKCIAVDPQYLQSGLSAKIVTRLIREEYILGRTHLFLFTRPANVPIFSSFGFYIVHVVPSQVALMENVPNGIQRFLRTLSTSAPKGKNAAAIVVNCNPFTLGHKHLIEYAAARCDMLHLFVVSEDKSSFPADVRYRLVVEGTKNIAHVHVHKGGDYIISAATFPTYFIKEYQEQVETHALLDIGIFGTRIAPALGIVKRYVGEEPFCKVTATYNRIMQDVLPRYGVDLEVIPRLTSGGGAVSASRVRALMREGKLEQTRELVPDSTYAFLMSEEARPVIRRIQEAGQRH
ncbi:MAG TPA: [citrate (pro-3S)-lyase] ligase [Dissulfurispiraceae bacterium]|nr:[citrate (pro-3S)-lyase] ligase [Dissulfurispiraceae bacterium]